MKINKVKCDHCGKELDTRVDFPDSNIETAHHYMTVDLCEYCLEELWKAIDAFCNTAKEGEKS